MIVSIAIVAVIFIEFWPSFGGSVTDEDQNEYKARNSLYKKGIFNGNPEIKLMTGLMSENKKEEKVYSLLDEIHPMTFENLLENSDFSAFELQHILMKFELKNIIYQIELNVYLRKI